MLNLMFIRTSPLLFLIRLAINYEKLLVSAGSGWGELVRFYDLDNKPEFIGDVKKY